MLRQYGGPRLGTIATSFMRPPQRGHARASTPRDYGHFLRIALGSASETRYLLGLASRLGLRRDEPLENRYDQLIRGLQKLIDAIGQLKPEA